MVTSGRTSNVKSKIRWAVRSHGWKRGGAGILSATEDIQRIAGRCGWTSTVKHIHSLFDYINIHSKEMDVSCALILAGWDIDFVSGQKSDRPGGCVPDSTAIKTSPELFTKFVDNLFGE